MQRSQAPCGALKEKIRGSSSGIEVPHFRQANFSENVSVSPTASESESLGTSFTDTMPSASAAAVSIESTRRLRMSGRITRRSTTTETSCLSFRSSST